MKRLLCALVLAWMLLGMAAAVWAACTSVTYFLPDGRIMICTTCCYGYPGSCSVYCI